MSKAMNQERVEAAPQLPESHMAAEPSGGSKHAPPAALGTLLCACWGWVLVPTGLLATGPALLPAHVSKVSLSLHTQSVKGRQAAAFN